MEHEIEITVRRWDGDQLASDGHPQEILLFNTTRQISDGVEPNIYDVLDSCKTPIDDAITEDIRANCQHPDIEADSKYCLVCGKSVAELAQDEAESRHEF